MKKTFAFIRIIRPINFLITFFSIVVAGIICSSSYYSNSIILAAFSGALVGSAGNIINDIFDIDIDRVNRPGRVLPSGALSRTEALLFYWVLNSAAVITAAFINTASFMIVFFSIIILFFYSAAFKKIPLTGNFVVAFMTGLAFIFGGTAVNNISGAIIPAIFAFLINFIREIIKDIEDLEGDLKNKIISYPARYGVKAALDLVFGMTVSLFILTFIPFIFRIYHIEYFMIVMLTVNTCLFIFIKNIAVKLTKDVISRGSFLLKLCMIFGLIAIYFGNN